MNILISGGTGLIGSALIAELSRFNHRIYVLSRSHEGASSHNPSLVYKKWDAKTPSGWGHVVNDVDVIINLAGENIAGKGFFPQRWSSEKKQSIITSRVNTGNAFIKAIKAASSKPNLIIQASAIGFYPFHEDDRILTEESASGNDFLSFVSTAWEKPVDELSSSIDIREIVIRIGIVLSPDGGALPRMLLPHKLFVGGPFGKGEQWYSWIHIQDICGAILYFIQNPDTDGVYNLTAPHPVKNKTFSKTLGSILSRPSYLPLPGLFLHMAFGEVADVVLKGQRVVPDRLLKSGYSFRFPDLESALKDLVGKS